ncbi:MAG TPA: FtsX-like permease family protein [Candidatus Acidoferrales bacterium]|nr:FtsX-like permease family protein [Candidatus Acidoferrales bacterium]
MKLFRTLILRPLARDPLRTVLTVLAVALGVAVVVAIDLAGDAATGSFQSSMQTLAGRTDLEILANGGVDERWMAALTALPLDVHWSPVMEAQAEIAGVGGVPLYGVDLAGASGIVVSQALARRIHVTEQSTVTLTLGGRVQRFPVSKIAGPKTADSTAEFLALDIADAQRALGRYGKLDRIDVTVSATEDFAAVEAAIARTLPPAYLIQKPGARSQENQRMLRAFRWNLRVLSYISLVVGAFLIYNTISVSVVRRRAEIGVLRALGAARAGILGLFLTEALIFGIVGAVMGVALGRVLASGTVRLIADTVNALYTTSRPTPVELTGTEAWLGILIGAAVALLSALAPAREAMEVAPTEAMSRGAHEHRARLRWRRGLGWSALLAVVALAASQAEPWAGYPLGGYVAAMFAIAATAMAAPAVVIAVNRLTRSFTGRCVEGLPAARVEFLLAARGLTAALPRTAVVVSALATAIAMMASVGIMVGSFRETVAAWLDIQLRADLYVRPSGPVAADAHPAMAPEVPGILAATPGVAAVDVFHALEFRYRGERATLGAGNMEVVRRYGRLRFLPGQDRDAILRSLPGRDRAIVSEPFANKHRLRADAVVTIPIGERNVTLTIAGVYYEYSSSQGYMIVDHSTLLKYLPNQPATNAAVYLAGGASPPRVQQAIQLGTARYGVLVAPNESLRRNAIAIFDRTFAITWALEAVAIMVAMLGAANSLLALVLDRRRELGLLRYLGASAVQVSRMILIEAAFLGALALLLGVVLGFAISLLLVFVVNKQSFGWTIQFHPPLGLLSGALLLVWCVTVLAGLYPARVAARLNPIDAIHEE